MLGIALNRASGVSLARQIHGHISRLILDSRLAAGDVLPSTRQLAGELGVSRNTVTEAYEMLWAEGYVASRQGSRFRVEENVGLKRAHEARPAPALPRVARAIRYDFRTGVPDMARFPHAAWTRGLRSGLELVKPGDMLYGDGRGYWPLRRAIAGWLLRSRGIETEAESVFITSGATHALSLAVAVLGESVGCFIVEKPCHNGIVHMLGERRLKYRAVPVDERGLRVGDIGEKRIAGVYVTPSHQFPLGHVLSADRRALLMRLVRASGGYVMEDDYDSEFRYGGLPLTPLHALDPERVIYVGSFSKTLFPALRIGFALVPERLRKSWIEARRYSDVQNPVLEQARLADFLDTGGMDRHVGTMRRIYARKRRLLVEALRAALDDGAEILGDGTGLHLAVRVAGRRFGMAFVERCRDRGIRLAVCGQYAVGEDEYQDTLLLGYGNCAEERIESGIALLSRLL